MKESTLQTVRHQRGNSYDLSRPQDEALNRRRQDLLRQVIMAKLDFSIRTVFAEIDR